MTDNDFTEGATVDVENGIVCRTGGFDYIDGFDGYVGSSVNESFIGSNVGNMGWQHVLRHVSTQRPSDFNARFAETNSAFFNEFIIVEVFSPGDGLDTIDGGEDGATVNYSWGPGSHGNEVYSNL